jgi:hypothetical protein
VLVLCGICAKYIKKKRFGKKRIRLRRPEPQSELMQSVLVKALRNLVSGEDAELASAYNDFHKLVEREQSLIGILTLAEGVEANRSLKQSERLYKQLGSTFSTWVPRDSSFLFILDREAVLEREDVLGDLSTHIFLAIHRDKFEKHHDGTCQWVLSDERFQRWLDGTENSILWCCGDREYSLVIMRLMARKLIFLKAGSGKTILTYVSTRSGFLCLVWYQSHSGRYTF